MADNNINIVISAVDNASNEIGKITGEVTNSLSKVSNEFYGTLKSEVDKLTQTTSTVISKTSESGNVFSSTFKKLSTNIDDFGARWDKMFKDHEANVQSLAIGSGVVFGGITLGIRDSIKASNELNAALVGLESIVKGTGNDFSQAKAFIDDFTKDGLVPVADAATSLKNLLSRGFGMQEAIEIMLRFKDSAAFGRQASLELGDAIKGATEGLKNENSVLVDNAGVTKNVSVMWKEYAEKIGVSEKNLTLAQKREAEYQGILNETSLQIGDAARLTETLAGEQAKQTAETVKLKAQLGTALTPAINELTKSLTPVITKIADWISKNPDLSSTIILATAALSGITLATSGFMLLIGPTISAIQGLIFIFTSLPTVITAVTTVIKGLGVALTFLATNPIAITITALTALGVGIWYVYNNWDTVKGKLISIWDTIKTAVNQTINELYAKIEWLVNKVNGAIDSIKSFTSSVGSALSKASEATARDFTDLFRAEGGPVSSGKPYIVGEQGPELFIPGGSGSIIPNNKLFSGSSNNNVSINLGNVNINNGMDVNTLMSKIQKAIKEGIQNDKFYSSVGI